MDPWISTAIATKCSIGDRAPYFGPFSTAECAAAAPAELLMVGRCYVWKMSGVVASQARHFPLDQGMRVAPSGLRFDPARSPDDSLVEVITALPSALCT